MPAGLTLLTAAVENDRLGGGLQNVEHLQKLVIKVLLIEQARTGNMSQIELVARPGIKPDDITFPALIDFLQANLVRSQRLQHEVKCRGPRMNLINRRRHNSGEISR